MNPLPGRTRRHGYTLQAIKEWRENEYKAGRPSGLGDFYRAHNICVDCNGEGKRVIGVRWRDKDRAEQSEEGRVALLVRRHGLDKPTHWLNDALKWDYLYRTCDSCKGSGTLKWLTEI